MTCVNAEGLSNAETLLLITIIFTVNLQARELTRSL